MEEYRAYEDAVMFVHQQSVQDTSVINASIISAVRGEYGNYHLTPKTHGSRLWISPLMSLYWFFDFPVVATRHAVLPAVMDSVTFIEAIRAAMTARRTLRIRPAGMMPL